MKVDKHDEYIYTELAGLANLRDKWTNLSPVARSLVKIVILLSLVLAVYLMINTGLPSGQALFDEWLELKGEETLLREQIERLYWISKALYNEQPELRFDIIKTWERQTGTKWTYRVN